MPKLSEEYYVDGVRAVAATLTEDPRVWAEMAKFSLPGSPNAKATVATAVALGTPKHRATNLSDWVFAATSMAAFLCGAHHDGATITVTSPSGESYVMR